MLQPRVIEVGEAEEDVMARFLQEFEITDKIIGQNSFRRFYNTLR